MDLHRIIYSHIWAISFAALFAFWKVAISFQNIREFREKCTLETENNFISTESSMLQWLYCISVTQNRQTDGDGKTDADVTFRVLKRNAIQVLFLLDETMQVRYI